MWTVAKIFSSTAHDVNNALQVISGSAELLEARGDLDPTTLRRVEAIRAQTMRATEAIDRLLTYTRHARGGVQPIDLHAVVEAAVTMRAFTLKRASVAIDRSRSDEEPYRTSVEPRAILQLVLTLLIFFERTFEKGRPARIAVRLEREPSRVVLSMSARVEDGGGFPTAEASGDRDPLAASQGLLVQRLAERQGGVLTIDGDSRTLRSARLTLPSS